MKSRQASRLCERNRIQPKTTRWKVTNQRSHAGHAPDPAAERVLGAQPGAVEGAPEHERPRRAVPEPAEHHRQHQVAVGLPAGPCGCRRAGCRGSRAGSARASCASAARSRGSRSRGRGCGSSAGTRSPSAARARSRCPCSRRSRSRSAPCRRRRRATRRARRRPAGTREHRVDDRAREVVGDHTFLTRPSADQRQPGADRDPVRVARRLQLRQELARAHDRPGDQVREEAQVDARRRSCSRARPAAA